MKVAFSAMMNPTQGLSLSRPSGTKVDTLLSNAAQPVRGDRVSLSEAGRKQAQNSSDGLLKSLMDRKSYLQEKRKGLLTSGAKDPTQKEFVKYQIKEIDKQLSEINQQMSDYLLQKQQEALEKQQEKKEEELSPEEVREKQLENVAQAKEALSRSAGLGVTRAVLKRSKAHAEEWAENSTSVSAIGNEIQRASYADTADKLDRGIRGLEHSQRGLAADAQKLIEQSASLAEKAAQAQEPEKAEEEGMLSSLEKEQDGYPKQEDETEEEE